MILTSENYYSQAANKEYMSVSQYKQFRKCEAAAMAQLKGEWEPPKTTALLVGSYVDAWCEGTLQEFRDLHPEIYKKDGTLKADYVQAEDIIRVIQSDGKLTYYLSGEKQIIKTAEIFGIPWKIKIDSYHKDKMIVDLKIMRSIERIMGKSFVEHWEYDTQMAIYSKAEGNDLETYLAVITKQTVPDKEIIHIPKWRREECLLVVEQSLPRIIAVKTGQVEPERCGVCEYCRATKKLVEPIDFDLVGFSAAEKRAILGK